MRRSATAVVIRTETTVSRRGVPGRLWRPAGRDSEVLQRAGEDASAPRNTPGRSPGISRAVRECFQGSQSASDSPRRASKFPRSPQQGVRSASKPSQSPSESIPSRAKRCCSRSRTGPRRREGCRRLSLWRWTPYGNVFGRSEGGRRGSDGASLRGNDFALGGIRLSLSALKESLRGICISLPGFKRSLSGIGLSLRGNGHSPVGLTDTLGGIGLSLRGFGFSLWGNGDTLSRHPVEPVPCRS